MPLKKSFLLPVLMGFFIAFGWVSCGGNTQSEKSVAEEPVIEEMDMLSETDLEEAVSIENEESMGKVDTWKGQINAKIPVTLTLQMTEDLAYGEVVYDKVGTPIQLIGLEEGDDYYRINEFSPEGMITGIWTFTITGETASGQWFSPETRKSMPVSLEWVSSEENGKDLSSISPLGEYSYSFGEEGSTGFLGVTGIKDGNAQYELICVTGAPAHHIASIEEGSDSFQNDKIQYRNSGEYMDCAFDIRFYRDFAAIVYIDNKVECGFGHNAFVEGVYLKTK